MKQIRQLVINVGSGTLYYHPLTPAQKSSGTVASSATIQMPSAGTIRNLAVEWLTSPSTSGTVRFDKNGSSTSLSVTVSNPSLTGSNTSDEVALSAGDTLVLVKTGTTGTATAMVSFEWEPDDEETSVYGFGGQNDTIGTSTHRDGLLDGGGNDWDSVADDIKTLVALDGTVTAWRMVLSASPGASNSRTFTVYKNGVAQDGSGGTPDTRLTISDANTSGSASFSLSFVSGDYLWVQTSHTGTPTTARASGSVAMQATTSGQWHVGAVARSPSDNTSTLYVAPSGRSDGTPTDWNATETSREHIAGITPYRLGGMIGRILTTPGSGKSIAYTLRKNGAGSTQTITFSDAETSAVTSGASVDFDSEADTLSLQVVPTSTPNVTSSFPKVAWWGSNIVPQIRGSFVAGATTTVNVSRAVAWGLDGATNVHDEEGVHKVFGASSVTEYFEQEEMATAPAAASGGAKKVRIWCEDDGSGKTRWMAQFATGSAVQLSIEP